MIAGLESIPESDFEHFSEFDDSDSKSNSNSSQNRFLYHTEIDSKIGYFIMAMILIQTPEKKEIATPLIIANREPLIPLPIIHGLHVTLWQTHADGSEST